MAQSPADSREAGTAGSLGRAIAAELGPITLQKVSEIGFANARANAERIAKGQSILALRDTPLVEGQNALVEGQKLVVDRLDRLVAASTRDRTDQIERIARLEQRVDAIEIGH